MKAGIGLVPEDRRQQGLVMELSIERNIGLTRLQALRNRLGVIGAGSEAKLAADWATKLQLKFHQPRATPSASCPAATSRRSCSASGSPRARRC